MTQAEWGELSTVLFWPTTLLLYLGAMLASMYAHAFTSVARVDAHEPVAGRRGQRIATGLATLGVLTHLFHLVARSLGSGGRVPWGNMFEYSSVTAFIVVAAGLVIFQWRLRKPQIMSMLLLGAILTMGIALLVYTDPGPLVPILNSHWLKIHVAAIVLAAGVFTTAFVFNALHLLRDTAERRVAAARSPAGSTVGAAYAGDLLEDEDEFTEAVPERDAVEDGVLGDDLEDDRAYGLALRAAINPRALFLGSWVAAATMSWVWLDLGRFLGVNTVFALAALVAWWFLPHLPSAATLDALTYRTIAFGFPIWTFAVLAGAVWAEQSWGRYWGWDPKETSAFLTWVGYAGYLHARATRGFKGRTASILGLGAYWIMLFTYLAVNLVVTGLHSYAGVS
ncbi:MAG: c-type cytochrome biogenesis protein CcsB [Nitriliruptorales bacterium]|nr:c-type cytochrome biogenesis protein CcsB [Nitriliruptorales bacterium]